MITTFFFLPLREEVCKAQTEYREREGMTLKRVERHLGDTAVYQPTDFQPVNKSVLRGRDGAQIMC